MRLAGCSRSAASHVMSHVTHINESWMSHVTHMNESWMSHVTHMNESASHVMNESCHTYEWVTPHTWTSHVTRINESCHTYDRVMSHTWMRHGTHTHESFHIHTWACHEIGGALTHVLRVTSHKWRHVTHVNESRHKCEWVMANKQMSHVTHTPEHAMRFVKRACKCC